MKQLKLSTLIVFLATIVVFFIILCQVFIPSFRDLFRGLKLFLLSMTVFCLLGLVLLIFALKEKMNKKSKIFLILTGASAVGFFVFVVLHNAFYGLGTATKEIFVLNYLIEGLDIAFFLIALFVCPIGSNRSNRQYFFIKKNRQ